MIVLFIVQVIGLLTFLHFNKTIKKLKKDNKRIKRMMNLESKPNYEKLGMTKEQYDKCMDTIYGMSDEQIRLYNPYSPKVIEDAPEQEEDLIFSMTTSAKEEDMEEELGELLGIEDKNEIERIQKEIENNQSKKEKELPTEDEDKVSENEGTTDLYPDEYTEEDLESLFQNEIPESEPIIEEEIEFDELQLKNSDKEHEEKAKKTTMGEGETLFNELFTALNNEQPEESQPLFSDDVPVEYDTPIFQLGEDTIPFSEQDIPHYPDIEENEQEKLINILNLLDKETSRLEKEVTEDSHSDKEEKKKILTDRLSYLAEQGEGKEHMKEIIKTLMELYQLEGKEKEMQSIKEEYKEYFVEDDMELRIFEEDIIRVDKKKENPFQIPEKYLWIATNSIADGKEGEQRWIGKCIGKNQNYIHFRDMSQRIWINVGKRIDQIEIGDLLAVFVERKGESITAKEVLTLKEVSVEEQEQSIVS
jgi:hypothetical protein